MKLDEIYTTNTNTVDIQMNDELSFYFFGCWNDNLLITMDIANRIRNDPTIQFGIVNGDNIYPEKKNIFDKNSNKKYSFDKIKQGFDVLRWTNKDTYLTIGNNELNNMNSNNSCKNIIDEINELRDKLKLPHNYYCINLKRNDTTVSKILCLDTNLASNNLCYDNESRKIYYNKMIEWLNNHLNDTNDTNNAPIFIVGHSPLFFVCDELNNNDTGLILCEELIQIYELLVNSNKNIIYLASHIHNFQVITHCNIIQLIVGTGGAYQNKIKNINKRIEYTAVNAKLSPDVAMKNNIFCVDCANELYGYLKISLKCDDIINKLQLCSEFNYIENSDEVMKNQTDTCVGVYNDITHILDHNSLNCNPTLFDRITNYVKDIFTIDEPVTPDTHNTLITNDTYVDDTRVDNERINTIETNDVNEANEFEQIGGHRGRRSNIYYNKYMKYKNKVKKLL